MEPLQPQATRLVASPSSKLSTADNAGGDADGEEPTAEGTDPTTDTSSPSPEQQPPGDDAGEEQTAQLIREQHYLDPQTGEKKAVRVKILRGGQPRR